MNVEFSEQLKPYAVAFISFYYKELGNSMGGNLHIVLDDGNIETNWIDSCEKDCQLENDTFGVFLCRLLKSMSHQERKKAYLSHTKKNSFWANSCS